MDRIEQALACYPRIIDLQPDRTRAVLTDFGSPQDKGPPVFHIAGTNGKGSTLAFLQAFFEVAGKKVHKFTGPHLVCFNERIVLAGRDIDDDYFLSLIGRIGRSHHLSRFEVMTVAAFLAFAENPADVVLLETGLGGLGDATNVVARPAVTLISRISMDHQRRLGYSLTDIARQKAGIMRRGVPCVAGAQFSAETETALAQCADHAGAPLYRFGHDWRVAQDADGDLSYEGMALQGRYPRPALLGEHQFLNAGLAIAALEQVNHAGITREDIGRGLTRAFWPARFQRLSHGPLPALLPENWELWLDGAHNDSGAEALARQLRLWRASGPVHVILGMKKTKDPACFWRALTGLCSSVQTVGVPEKANCYDAQGLAAHIDGAVPAQSCAHALRHVQTAFPFLGPARIVMTGSLLLAGHVLRDNG